MSGDIETTLNFMSNNPGLTILIVWAVCNAIVSIFKYIFSRPTKKRIDTNLRRKLRVFLLNHLNNLSRISTIDNIELKRREVDFLIDELFLRS